MRVKSIALLALSALMAAGLGCARDEEGGVGFIPRSLRANALDGRSVLIVIPGDGYRDEEAYVTRDTLAAAGAAVSFAAPTTQEAKAAIMGSLTPDVALSAVSVEDYDAVVFVGWQGEPGLAGNEAATALAEAAGAAGKVVAGIDQGISVLEASGLVEPLEGAAEGGSAPTTGEASSPGAEEGETAEESAESAVTVESAPGAEGDEGEAAAVSAIGSARRAVPPTPEELADEDHEPETVVRDGSIVTAVGPRDAGGFAQHISAALAEAAAQNAK